MNADAQHSLLRSAIVAPFLIVALIWGSTWYVILGQIDGVPASWSIAYRFILATPCMAVLALATGRGFRGLAIGTRGQGLAVLIGVTQFCGNFNFVYRAEIHLTSGIVAVMFSLMIVTNAIFARILLGQSVSSRFYWGGAMALAGIALLLLHEAQAVKLAGNVPLGVVLAIGGILSASIANVLQANRTGAALPMASLLAWSMFYGTLCNVALAWLTAGAPVLPQGGSYWIGTVFLAIAGSVVTFPLYYGLIRKIGAGKAAYQNILVIVVAMTISTAIEGYTWSPLSIAGAVLALAGMALALRARSTPPPEQETPLKQAA